MRKVPWVNLWMMAFGGAGIWIVANNYYSTDLFHHMSWHTVLTAFIILGVVGLVGFVRLPLSFFYESSEAKMINLNHLVGVYLRAWKGLWRRKWMLWVFGGVGVVVLLGGLSEVLLTRHYLAARFEELGRNGTTSLEHLPQALAGKFAENTANALHWSFPQSGLGGSTGPIVVTAAALVLTLPWLYLRLGRLRNEGVYSKDAQFLQIALVSAGIVALAVLAVMPRSFILGLQGIAQRINRFPDSMYAFVVTSSVWMLVQVVLDASIISGLIGSLKQGDEKVTFDSFLKTSVRYFKPVAGLYLLMALIVYALEIPQIKMMFSKASYQPIQAFAVLHSFEVLATLLLMLVPFTIVVWNLGTWHGIRAGVKDWLHNAGQVVSFIALGITFLVPVLLLTSAVNQLISPLTGMHIFIMPFSTAIHALMTALMLLAVWEFYNLIVGEREADHA